MPQRFRKLPVEVDAWQLPRAKFVKGKLPDMPAYLVEAIENNRATARPSALGFLFFYIETLEGRMKVMPGDWIVRGVQGELYPVKPDIFAQTYEPAQKPACANPDLDSDCSGCTDDRSEGTHQGCTKQHGHVGCDRS